MHNWAEACWTAVFFVSICLLSVGIAKVFLLYPYIFIGIIVLIPVILIIAVIIKFIWYIFDKDS